MALIAEKQREMRKLSAFLNAIEEVEQNAFYVTVGAALSAGMCIAATIVLAEKLNPFVKSKSYRRKHENFF